MVLYSYNLITVTTDVDLSEGVWCNCRLAVANKDAKSLSVCLSVCLVLNTKVRVPFGPSL